MRCKVIIINAKCPKAKGVDERARKRRLMRRRRNGKGEEGGRERRRKRGVGEME